MKTRLALDARFGVSPAACSLAALLGLWFTTVGAQALPPLGADLSAGMSVSGISSGGYMAVQFQVAHSALVKGAAIVAAGPYDCAAESVSRALANCMEPTAQTPAPSGAETLARAAANAEASRIDPPAALRDDRVWLLSGGADRTVATQVVDALADFYRVAGLPAAALVHERLEGAGHAMPSIALDDAVSCETSASPYISRCGDFDAAGRLLAHLLGAPGVRVAQPAGQVVSFEQAAFSGGWPANDALGDTGFAYVPPDCRRGGCRVHVAFHGCKQSFDRVGQAFVAGAGYNHWADSHRLIVLYPQARARYGFGWGALNWVWNPNGCWDWWGYLGDDYATRDAPQIRAVMAMLRRLGESPAAQ